MNQPFTPPHPSQKEGGGSAAAPSHRERDDNYHEVVAQLSPRWRVIVCADGIQWIIQKKEASHAAPWRGVKYVTSRDGLIALCGSLELPINANVRALFDALPERPRDYQLQTQSK